MNKNELPPQLGLSIDGGELTAVSNYQEEQIGASEFISFLPSALAYHLSEKPSALILDARGGLDLLTALFYKAKNIKVLESNPLLVKTLKKELAQHGGSLYENEKIHVVSGNTRTLLNQEKNSYDLIVFSLTDVFGSSSSGIHGFRENYLYTLESFMHLYQLLAPQGFISITLYLLPPPRQEIKMLATLFEAMEKNHLDPNAHLLAIRSWGTISYFIKRTRITEKNIDTLKAFSNERLFDLVYYPGIKAEETNRNNIFDKPIYYDLVLKLLSSQAREKLYENYLFKIEPATDNKPFFYNFFKLNKIRKTYKALGGRILPLLQGGFLIPFLFIQALLISFICILLPLLFMRKRFGEKRGIFPKILAYFSIIGAAFMFVEIIMIQKFILFLDHPLYSISTVIFSLLFSSGMGSLFSKHILGKKIKNRLRVSLVICSSLILLYLFLLPFLFEQFFGLTLPVKIIMTFFIIFPLGFIMGFPFPSGIRLLEQAEKRFIPWAWATNSFSSVLFSVAAIMIGVWSGYNFVLVLAAVSYLVALTLLDFSDHRDKTNT
jgi:predicted membrane-bound spermidine synthase